MIRLRIPRLSCEHMRRDLGRPHRVAAERIGFARVAVGTVNSGSLLLLTSYWAVPDEQYVDDPYVGARINSTAIRHAMQDVLSGGGAYGLFHVHLHPRKGRTGLSKTDVAEIPKLVSSFRNVGPEIPHGLIVLTPDHALAFALLPGADKLVQVGKITIVGYPTETLL